MALSSATGSFNIGTGAAATTVAVTGTGFTPKAVLFWWASRTGSTDGVGRANQLLGFGWAASTTQRHAVGSFNTDAAGSSQARNQFRGDACVLEPGSAGATGLADLQSFDSDGFTLVIDDQFTTNLRVQYLALGGDSLTAATAGSFTAAGTAPVNQSVTGLAFQPTAVLFLGAGPNDALPSDTTDSAWCLGVAVSSSQEAVWMGGANGGGTTMQTISYCRAGECIVKATAAVGAASANDRAEFVSMNSDGFTINWLERAGTGDIAYLALGGVNALVGDLLTQTDTTTAMAEGGFGFQPTAALVVSHGQAQTTQDDPDDHARVSIGAATSATSRQAVGALDEDNTADVEATQAAEFDAVYVNIATDSTVQGVMDVQSFDSAGITFIMDDADPSQAFAWYLALGPAAAGGVSVPKFVQHYRNQGFM